MTKDKSRIQSCIDHINTAVDVDPWAKELVAEMGKEILKAQLSKEDATSDCISRQAAIRWVKTECNPYGKPTLDFESGKRVMEHLKTMPSVQPVGKDINVSCKDAISRQAVIDICNHVIDLWEGQLGEGALVAIKNAINNLPSVQPEIMPDGTLHITVNADVANIDRILLSQAGTHLGDLYYRDDERPEPYQEEGASE